MKILIAGASGMIGQRIVTKCRKRGDVVHFLTTDKSKLTQEDNFKGFYWNPGKNEIDVNCFSKVEAVINLSGESIGSAWTPTRKRKILNSRIQSVELLRKSIPVIHNIMAFASASAVGIYPHSFTNYYEEDEKVQSTDFLGKVVRSWENEIGLISKQYKFPVATIRTGMVLSDTGGALNKLIGLTKKYMGAVIGSGEQWVSWIHIDDIAGIYLYCIDKQLEGIYNAVAPNPVTNTKLTHELADSLRKPIVMPSIPVALLKLILGERALLLYSSQRVSSRKIEDHGYHFRFSNLKPALKDLVLHEKSQLLEELA